MGEKIAIPAESLAGILIAAAELLNRELGDPFTTAKAREGIRSLLSAVGGESELQDPLREALVAAGMAAGVDIDELPASETEKQKVKSYRLFRRYEQYLPRPTLPGDEVFFGSMVIRREFAVRRMAIVILARDGGYITNAEELKSRLREIGIEISDPDDEVGGWNDDDAPSQ